ncbi:hypothetical protein [Dyadobacter frigoris]|uniref:Glycosyltransferase RgtA/B/C/D-like domain-containing protein n=1 Tax=Dyadobacter frigoris TaxID=2576211 RepID=A0A4U6D587_9BACT|nr:hypothetical protein [Dyadobacter frigoris]TKT92509.1 hypothetical protein FDK13_11150 [Dyadobacter frigoris]GLU55302.1 hypothetical protein Dfri01_47630 [Dyadobacter frigoris]
MGWVKKPWTEGKLAFSDLWNSHNEHRIFPTRLLTLLSFELTGVWSNLTETRLNILLGASTPLLLIWLLYKGRELYGLRWLVVAVIVAGAVFPFSWENLLIGFQSQFYFLNLFTLSALALAVFRSRSTSAMVVVAGLCCLSIVTMASGLVTPIAIAIVYAADGYTQKNWSPKKLLVISILLIIAATGYFTMPYVAGHNFLHAQNMTEMVKTTIRVMGWPLTDHKLYIGLMWLPTLITIPVLLSNRRFTRFDLLMFGCFIWTGAEVLALAYGRGHALFDVSSRYTEILHLGLAGNAWFVIRPTEEFFSGQKSKIAITIVALLFFAALFFSHAQRFPLDIVTMKNDRAIRLIQTKNVHLYLKTRDKKPSKNPGCISPIQIQKTFKRYLTIRV